MRGEKSDSTSYVRLHHRDSDPRRHTNSNLAGDAKLLAPYHSNLGHLDFVLSALLFQMKQLLSELASRDAGQSADITAVSDRLNRLKRSRSDRSDRESANLHLPLPPQPVTVVVESHESRRDRAHTPPENAVLDPIRDYGLLPVPSASHLRESDLNRRDASRPFVLPPDRHAGFVANALPPPHAGFASLPPPHIPQPQASHSLVPAPMPS